MIVRGGLAMDNHMSENRLRVFFLGPLESGYDRFYGSVPIGVDGYLQPFLVESLNQGVKFLLGPDEFTSKSRPALVVLVKRCGQALYGAVLKDLDRADSQ
jgi:hypothetical protein